MIILIILFQREKNITLYENRGLFMFFHVTTFDVLRGALFRCSRLQMFFKIGVLKLFAIFT